MLKHLTLSSGCMQKQQWMLHLYWIEVIRRKVSASPQNQDWTWESGPVFTVRSAGAHRAKAAGRSGFFLSSQSSVSSPLRRLGDEDKRLPPTILEKMRRQIVQKGTWGRNKPW